MFGTAGSVGPLTKYELDGVICVICGDNTPNVIHPLPNRLQVGHVGVIYYPVSCDERSERVVLCWHGLVRLHLGMDVRGLQIFTCMISYTTE